MCVTDSNISFIFADADHHHYSKSPHGAAVTAHTDFTGSGGGGGGGEKNAVTLDEALDELNSFISAMTVPDPADDHTLAHLHRVTSEDIRLLVIPPPPVHSPSRSGSTSLASSTDRIPATVRFHGGGGDNSSTNGNPNHGHGAVPLIPNAVKPPIPPKPKVIPPPPPIRNKSLERKQANLTTTPSPTKTASIIPGLVSPHLLRRSGSRDIESTDAFKNCVAEIDAQLCEIAIRRSGGGGVGGASSESDLVSTTPSASEETTPVMWRKNPVLNCRQANRKPPPVGGLHPNATVRIINDG